VGTRFIYLVRHGDYGPGGSYDPKRGHGLTALGIRQAQAAAKRFEGIPVSGIHTSTLLRAAETAAIIAKHLPSIPVHADNLLCEVIPNLPPGTEMDLDQWGPKKLESDRARAEKALVRYFKPARGADKHDVIVAHGNLIRYMVCRVLGADAKMWTRLDMCNCGISKVLVKPDGTAFVVSHNSAGHLPRTLRRFLHAT